MNNGQVPLQPLHVQIPQNAHEIMSLPSERLLIPFPEQSGNEYSVHSNTYRVSHSHTDMHCESKAFEPVLLQNGQIMNMHSKQQTISSHQLKSDVFSKMHNAISDIFVDTL
jgi:hypothetical protein